MPIKKANDLYGNPGADACRELMQRARIPVANPVGDEAAGDPLYVVVNHGRWVVECPTCLSAQVADPDDRRFYCVRCLNATNSMQYRPVVWPNEIQAIETALLVRPFAENQNWHPPEMVADLLAENSAHRVGG